MRADLEIKNFSEGRIVFNVSILDSLPYRLKNFEIFTWNV